MHIFRWNPPVFSSHTGKYLYVCLTTHVYRLDAYHRVIDVFERRTSTGSELFASLGIGFTQIFVQIVSIKWGGALCLGSGFRGHSVGIY